MAKKGCAVNTLAMVWISFERMSDLLERLYQAVIAAKDLDPAVSRTARLFQRGPAKMAKKLAEEAIEVVIDAVNGKPDAVIRESADLLYNLTVLWAAAGVRPEDVWREMERREHLLGIAEKLPKSPVKMPKAAARLGSPGDQLSRSKAAPCASATSTLTVRISAHFFPPAWTNPPHGGSSRHAETDLRLVHRRRPQALCALDFGSRRVRGKLLLPGAARHHAAADVAGAAAAGLAVCGALHGRLGAGGVLGYAIGALLYDSVGHWLIHLYGLGDKVEAFRASYAEWGA